MPERVGKENVSKMKRFVDRIFSRAHATLHFAVSCTFESAYQFVFMFFIWLHGGQCELFSMLTSLLMIAKSRVEKHLMASTNPMDEAKDVRERAFLLAFFLPTFLITTIFRLTSLAVIFACLAPLPDPLLSFYLYGFYYFVYGTTLYVIVNICAMGCPNISSMSLLERGHAVTGEVWLYIFVIFA